MKILIIGSKGFIGSHAYQYFKNMGQYITYASDIVNDYNDSNYFQISSSDADFNSLFRKIKPDWCINCSGAASVANSFLNPLKDFSLNVNNLHKILFTIKEEAAHCKLIQLSSAAVYGNPTLLPIEETSALHPLSPYGLHKKQAEELCALYHDNFGVSSYIIRIFSAYGNGLKKQLFWDLYQKLNSPAPIIQLFGSGDESRDFIHVKDVVSCFELIIKKVTASFDIFNLANGHQITISNVATMFKELGNFNDKKIEFIGNNRIGDPLHWEAGIGKISKLGYQNQISLEAGLSDYISWLKD
ncbi:NAD(P)-dependent oxidoreductase [Pedobacter sp.]|uniref:NAD-dependent epimerase/dehydratase family protein n=1 Tax=Pedobacter sp. TaxID=1411316 RepID=UPI0031D2E864